MRRDGGIPMGNGVIVHLIRHEKTDGNVKENMLVGRMNRLSQKDNILMFRFKQVKCLEVI